MLSIELMILLNMDKLRLNTGMARARSAGQREGEKRTVSAKNLYII